MENASAKDRKQESGDEISPYDQDSNFAEQESDDELFEEQIMQHHSGNKL